MERKGILFNVTVKVETGIHEEWLKWMQEKHIPEVMQSGFFTENRICRLLINEDDGVTFAIQYYCKSLEDFQAYEKNVAPRLRKDHADRYGERALAFRTLLEIIS